MGRELIAEMRDLINAHLAEVTSGRQQPSDDVYELLEQAGRYAMIVARDRDTRAVRGYSGFLIEGDRAIQDGVYLAPDARIGLTGLRLIAASDQILKELGVLSVYRQSPESKPCGVLLRRAGYQIVETVYGRQL